MGDQDFGPLLPDPAIGFVLAVALVVVPLLLAVLAGVAVGRNGGLLRSSRLRLAPSRSTEAHHRRLQ